MAFMHPVARCTSGELLPARRKYREVQNHMANIFFFPGKSRVFLADLRQILRNYLTSYSPSGTIRFLNRKRVIGFAIKSTYAYRISANHFGFSVFLGRVGTIDS